MTFVMEAKRLLIRSLALLVAADISSLTCDSVLDMSFCSTLILLISSSTLSNLVFVVVINCCEAPINSV